MNELLTGAIAMGFAIAAVFFLRFWRETNDRLFLLFALSFVILSLNRVALGIAQQQQTRGDYFYWIRLIAFGIILLAILDKNRSRSTDADSGVRRVG